MRTARRLADTVHKGVTSCCWQSRWCYWVSGGSGSSWPASARSSSACACWPSSWPSPTSSAAPGRGPRCSAVDLPPIRDRRGPMRYLFCAVDEAGMRRQHEWVAAQREWGLDDVELLPGDEVRYRFPHVGPNVLQARYRAGDGWLKPKALTLGYAVASGATICLDTPEIGRAHV